MNSGLPEERNKCGVYLAVCEFAGELQFRPASLQIAA